MSKRNKRYGRLDGLPSLKGIRANSFKQMPMAIIGLGNVGGQVAHHLALLGCPLILIDNGKVSEENLGTQGFQSKDMNHAKIVVRSKQLRDLNPECEIKLYYEDISTLGVGCLTGAKVLFSCLDSWYARSVLHEIAWELGIPLIDGGIDGTGEQLMGRVTIYDPRLRDNACMFCSWDKNAFQKILSADPDSRTPCPELRLGPVKGTATPTFAPSSLGGIVAGIMAIDALRMVVGDIKESNLGGRELLIDLSNNSFAEIELNRNPNCVFPHQILPLESLGKSISQLTVKEIFKLAERELGSNIRLSLHRKHLAQHLICQSRHILKNIDRIVETFPQEESFCHCGSPLFPLTQSIIQSFSYEQASSFLDKTWKTLGLAEHDIISARNGQQAKQFVFN
jgi:molybdopterin/thiamine biosynthesis adenylyltransferase